MFFSLSKIFWIVISPLNFLTVCIALITALSVLTRRIYARTLFVLVFFLLVFGVMPIGHDSLVFLENRFAKPEEEPSHVEGIILLGGTILTELSSVRGEVVVGDHGARLFAFLQFARQYPEARLIVTGGNGSLFHPDLKEADYMRELFDSLGIDQTRVIYERESRNTYENAKFVKELIGEKSSRVWMLVTSAYHMPRSMGVFRQQGVNTVAYPTGYMTDGIYHMYPRDFDVMEQYRCLNIALKEYIGNIVYFLGRKSNSFMPG